MSSLLMKQQCRHTSRTVPLPQFPTELLRGINGYLCQPELLSCCLVSKLFNSASTSALYQRICLNEEPAKIVLCCKTLSSNILAARSVRFCSLICTTSCKSSAFYRVIQSALIWLRGITTLELLFRDDLPHSYFAGLEHCSFPNLQTLRILMDLSPPIFVLMCHHRLHVRHLCIKRHARYLSINPICTFPQLESFNGSLDFLPAFLPESPVQSISVKSWKDIDVEANLSALSKTFGSLAKVSIHSGQWDTRLFESLSQHAPNVQDIAFESYGTDADIISAFMTCVTSLLPKFKSIRSLTIMPSGLYHGLRADSSVFLDDYNILLLWGKLCPSMRLCRLPVGALQWLLVDGNGWIPHREDIYTWYHLRHLPTKDLQGFVWLDSFVKRLCEDCGLDNPFEDTQNSNDTDENVDGTDFISLPSEFLRRVRTSL